MIYVSLVLSVISFILCVFILFRVDRLARSIESLLEIINIHSKTLGSVNKTFKNILSIPSENKETKS